jgi:hypothetical protein
MVTSRDKRSIDQVIVDLHYVHAGQFKVRICTRSGTKNTCIMSKFVNSLYIAARDSLKDVLPIL